MFTGYEFLKIWEAGKRASGLSQRKMAEMLGVNFNAMHGKLFRAQKALEIQGEPVLNPVSYDRVMLRSAVFDIECMDFAAGGIQNHLVCTSILPLDKDEVSTLAIRFDDQRDDKRLLEEVRDALEEFDILIGHNVAAFDFNWLNSRFAYHHIPGFQKRFLYYDTYQAARRMSLKADRKSLGFLVDFFQIEGEKTAVMPVSWSMIDSPVESEFEEALADIIDHCEKDVRANKNLFDALWPLDRSSTGLPMTRKW